MRMLFSIFMLMLVGCGDIIQIKIVEEEPRTLHIFGNSMMAWNEHGVRRELDELYNWVGNRVIINDSAFVGATVEQIHAQYTRAKDRGEIVKTAIVEGGANNIFLNAWWCWTNEGDELNDRCKEVVDLAINNLSLLVQDIHNNGAERIVLLVPYHDIFPSFNAAIDYSLPKWPSICPESWCSLVELSSWIHPDDSSLYWIDGIHPSGKGSRRIARVIYNTLNNAQVAVEED